MSSISFVKMLANGNSLLLVDARDLPDYDWPELACQTAARFTGVGHDGLIVVLPSEIADVRQRMFNPDGTEDMCGNRLRCIGKLLSLAKVDWRRSNRSRAASWRADREWSP